MSMMRMMFRAVLKRYWKILLFIAVISAVGCGAMTSISSASRSLDNTFSAYIDRYGIPDATVTTAVTKKKDKIRDLLALAEVEEVNTRFVANTVIRGSSGQYYSVRVMSFDGEDFQKLYMWETAEESGALDSVYLDYVFAHNNGFAAGDVISVRVGEEYRDYYLAGIVSAVETLNVTPIDGLRIYSTDFGYLYAPSRLVEKEANREYEDNLAEWKEKRQELTDAETDAEGAYQNALTDLADAEAELNEKRAEFTEKRPELEEQRADLTRQKEELLQLQRETEEKKTELDDQQKELTEKQTELTEQQQELDQRRAEAESQQQELEEKKAEAEQQQRELNEKKAEADEARAELEENQALLDSKRAELNEGWDTLEEQKQQVIDGHREAQKQLRTLQTTRQELLDGRIELEEARNQAIRQREELIVTRAELYEKRAGVQSQLNALRLAQTYQSSLNEAIAASGVRGGVQAAVQEIDSRLSDLEAIERRLEQAKAALSTIDAAISLAERMGMDTAELVAQRQEVINLLGSFGISEGMIGSALSQTRASIAELQNQREALLKQFDEMQDPAVLEERTKALQAQLDAAMSNFGAGGNVTEAMLENYIRQAESGLNQIDDGIAQIDDGLRQIKEGLELADEKEAEIQDGLARIDAGEIELKDAVRQTEEALPLLNDALRQMWDGKLEIADYQAQLDEGWAELNDGYAQIADYQAQLDEGYAQIADYETQLDEGFAQIEDYQTQIDEGFAQIADYQTQIDEGFTQIEEGLTEISDGLTQIDDGISQIDEGIADAERQLQEGEEALSKARAEAETAWLDALTQFDELERELADAWAELSEWEGFEALCNQFLLKFAPGADPETALEAAKTALGDAEIKSAILYEDSAVRARIGLFTDTVGQMGGYMPVIMFAVALVVVFLFISLMVRQYRRELGILRALGFSKGRIRLLFCYIAFLISLLACALGGALGAVLALYLGGCFTDAASLPFYLYTFDVPNYAVACALTVLVCQAAMILGTHTISRIQPAEAMSRPAPSGGEPPALLRGWMKNAPPFFKFSLSSLLRNRLRFLYSAFCVACTVMIIFACVSFIVAKEKMMENTYSLRIRYDCEIFFTQYPDAEVLEELEALDGVSDLQRLGFYSLDLTFNGREERVLVNALDESSDMIRVYDEKEKALPLFREGVVLEKRAAEAVGAKAGDVVELGGVPMKVTGISTQNVSFTQYLSLAQAEAMGNPALEAVLCRVDPAREKELIGFLKDQDDYVFSIFTRIARQGNSDLFSTYDAVSYLLAVIASALGMVIIVTTARSNLLEQKRELCVLRTLGFQHSQISRYWFLQSLLQFLVSCAIGLPAGLWMEKEGLAKLANEQSEYPLVNEPRLYLITLTVVAAFVILSHVISMRAIKKWDIVETVKDKE